MALPSPEAVRQLLASSRTIRRQVLAIACRLEALNEYSSDQALSVAADIVLSQSPGIQENDSSESRPGDPPVAGSRATFAFAGGPS
jgi:hypothetical protein